MGPCLLSSSEDGRGSPLFRDPTIYRVELPSQPTGGWRARAASPKGRACGAEGPVAATGRAARYDDAAAGYDGCPRATRVTRKKKTLVAFIPHVFRSARTAGRAGMASLAITVVAAAASAAPTLVPRAHDDGSGRRHRGVGQAGDRPPDEGQSDRRDLRADARPLPATVGARPRDQAKSAPSAMRTPSTPGASTVAGAAAREISAYPSPV